MRLKVLTAIHLLKTAVGQRLIAQAMALLQQQRKRSCSISSLVARTRPESLRSFGAASRNMPSNSLRLTRSGLLQRQCQQ